MLFTDAQDSTQLSSNLTVTGKIPPQLNQVELIELEEMAKSVAAATVTCTISILIAQVFLHFGLKYLWNIMNLIQFLIFMQMWLISLPPYTRIFLSELKALALLEFIPYQWLSGESSA